MRCGSVDRAELVQEACKLLARIGAVKFGVFKLTSGKTSPYYIDLRLVPSFPDAFRFICDAYATMIEEELGLEAFDRIAGVPTSGIPFAAVVAFRLEKPFLYVRKEVKLHGRERRVEGVLAPGDRVILLDDLITTGKTLAEAAKAIRAEGGEVEHAFVLIDREEGGRDTLAQVGVRLHALMTVREMAKLLLDMGAIEEEQYELIMNQVSSG